MKPTISPVSCVSTVTYALHSVTATGGSAAGAKTTANVDWKSSFSSFFDLTYDKDANSPADGQGRWSVTSSDYTGRKFAPTTYTFTIRATNLGGGTVDSTFTWTLTDPCITPTTHTISTVSTTKYVIGTTEDITYPTATISPNFCSRTFDVTIPVITGLSKTTVSSVNVVRFKLTDLTYLVSGASTLTTKNAALTWKSTIVGYYTVDTKVVTRTDQVAV